MHAVETATPQNPGTGITLPRVRAVAFVATKLEASASRGGDDFLTSPDLEDVLNIVDGREDLAADPGRADLVMQHIQAPCT